MIQQMSEVANEGAKSINVLCDDTDDFVLLVYHYSEPHLRCSVTMEGTSAGRLLVDTGATAKKHDTIIKQLPAAHALSGCDTVAQLFGIGKGTVLKILRSGSYLSKLGESSEEWTMS